MVISRGHQLGDLKDHSLKIYALVAVQTLTGHPNCEELDGLVQERRNTIADALELCLLALTLWNDIWDVKLCLSHKLNSMCAGIKIIIVQKVLLNMRNCS